MRTFWKRIREQWNRTDTVVLASNHVALGVFIANCWWQSVTVCYAASVIPLLLQIAQARRVGGTLRDSLWFGALIGCTWPLGEGFVTSTVGWWGEYTAPGPMLWRTPVYCVLIGWLASTHIFYVGRRFEEIGYGVGPSLLQTTFTAFAVGVLGENLFVWAGMWRYDPSPLDWGGVPAFVPIAYGLGYGVLPLIRRWNVFLVTAVCGVFLFAACIGLGLVTGFFPR